MKTNPNTKTANTGTKTVVRDVEDVLDKIPYKPEFRQFNRRGNIRIAHCYALYLQGYSLGYIADVIYRGQIHPESIIRSFQDKRL